MGTNEEDTTIREFSEKLYDAVGQYDKYTLMDVEFMVEDLIFMCATHTDMHLKFNEFIINRKHQFEKSGDPDAI